MRIAGLVKSCILLLTCLWWAPGPLAAEMLSGTAVVLDGDTVRIGETRVRLEGIDAPESDQICMDGSDRVWSCGIAARDALAARIVRQALQCTISGSDAYDRKLGNCAIAGESLNAWMVKEGFALAYRKYSHAYIAQEDEARAAGRRLWAGAFIPPWEWRRRGPQTTALLGNRAAGKRANELFEPGATSPVAGCDIKGNVNRTGNRIYHMPGQRDYARVNMKASPEKRWFCSEEEAQAAGWRRAVR